MEEIITPVSIPEDCAGQRLDKAVELCVPGLSVRGRKRLWEDWDVQVDGRSRPKGYIVEAGQVVSLHRREASPSEAVPAAPLNVEVVTDGPLFATIRKPGGLHSAAISGREADSVEARLPELFPGRDVRLLNRLDGPTSGLLLVGFSEEAAARFHELEDAGEIRKTYLAVVRGTVLEPFSVGNALDTDNRRVTKVLAEEAASLRHTSVEPLGVFPGTPLTLVRAVIFKGARHQIRAHLAHAGYPILGDAVYGDGAEGDILHLHHCLLEMPGLKAVTPPRWEKYPAADHMCEASAL